MQKRLRDLLRVLVADLRHTLSGGPNGQRGDLDRELERLGIAPDGTVTPFDALPNPTPAERRARRVAEAQLAAAPAARRAATRAEVVERAAYTWINRLLALRAAEARGLIDEILRSDPAYDGLSEALFILRQTQPQRAAGPDGGWWAVIEDACRVQAASLPGLFDLADPSAALRPSVPALLRCVAIVGNPPAGYTADEAEATFADPDAIGWAYQFYQEEAKARTYARLNSGGKAATRAEIAAVTQLFTEPYMVKWLLQNSLGRTYHELYTDSKLPETWEYYIRISESEESANQRVSDDSPIHSLEDLTFMDPCMGSGHFEREAFDMYFAMYREQHPEMAAAETADRILTRHLHGIDLDPRAAQLTALTLYLRAWELVAGERRAKRLPGPGSYRPPAMNLATTPTGLTPGSLERHLQRHPEDRIYRPLLEGIFAALEQADVLGSLLRPGEQLDAAIRAFRVRPGGQMQLVSEDTELNRLLGELARHDPGELKRVLLDRVARSFAAEAADADDVTMMLFGREAGEGLRLLQLLDRTYAVVATNPPYMGSGSVTSDLRQYIENHFPAGKRDLYAAFILRCLGLAASSARVAMVTMQGWMFLRSYNVLRAAPEGENSSRQTRLPFSGLLRETTIEAVAHLGPNAFEEISGEVVQIAMFVFSPRIPEPNQSVVAFRLVGLKGPIQKADALRRGIGKFVRKTHLLAELPGSPFGYWLSESLLRVIGGQSSVKLAAQTRAGLTTAEGTRFYRKHWELPRQGTWLPIANGGSYKKWHGHDVEYLRWGIAWEQVLSGIGNRLPSREYYTIAGVVLSQSARGCLSCRLSLGRGFTNSSIAVFPIAPMDNLDLAVWFNNRCASYLVRLYSQKMGIEAKHLDGLPLLHDSVCHDLARYCSWVKAFLVGEDPVEATFDVHRNRQDALATLAVLHAAEGAIEERILVCLQVSDMRDEIFQTTGTPVGCHPLIMGYDTLPSPHSGAHWPAAPAALANLVRGLPHLTIPASDLARHRTTIRTLYAAGPGAKDVESDEVELAEGNGEEESAPITAAYIPIPAETFLEELSQKLQIHPISVYWLLEELRAEGVRCKPEELRLLDDRLSVLVLRLLGHRWPRQIEAGEPVPSWADPDGIVPLTAVAGEASLAERGRDRLRAEDGDRGAQQVEALLLELTGQSLDEWLRRNFFVRHVRQFKHRPIAWHLASTPTKDGGRRKAKREPAFQCLLYYQACRGDVLARLRAHYVEPLIRLETAAAAEARRRGDETAAAIAVSRVQELEEFAARLREVEESGFACAELDRLLADEALDRWSGDGIVPPANADELAAQERAWRADINDGVRVNIAPLQLAGLLTSDVLRPDDARKAIADRARWRSDERRWVREGVLPRCGWMDEDVPESPRWTERAPEREAERRKLEEKRKAAMERLAGNADPSG